MTPRSRREFLTASGLLAFSLPAVSREPKAIAQNPVVDTHLHCFAGSADKRFPYHKDAPYTPDDPATPEHLLKCMDGAGVDFAVVVHPEPYQDDHRYLEHCLSVGKEPIIKQGVPPDLLNYTDPMPQALVLTAIVISFATTALFLVVLLASRGLTDSDHVDGREEEP